MSEERRTAYFRPRQCWYRTLNDYCRRRITYSKDILPAISGVAKEYRRYLKQEYRAGLWRDDMHLGLLWSNSTLGAIMPSTYVAPSWSWASLRIPNLDRSITEYSRSDIYDHDLVNYPLTRCVANIIGVDVTSLDQDPFGRVAAGFPKISGLCHELCHCNLPRSFFDCYRRDQGPLLDYQTLRRAYHLNDGNNPPHEACTVDNVSRQQCQLNDTCSALHGALTLLHIASHTAFAFALILEPCDHGTGVLQKSRNGNPLRNHENIFGLAHADSNHHLESVQEILVGLGGRFTHIKTASTTTRHMSRN